MVSDDNYLKVLARKVEFITEDSCISTGAAARGHILEPYAIDFFNENMQVKLYHWDDLIIKKGNYLNGLAFSPDAMDIPMSTHSTIARVIGEVKCYSPERHVTCGHTKKEDLEERWQLATAMAVLPNIESGYLLFYNPSMAMQMFVVKYDREDLKEEIKTVYEIEDNWLNWIDALHTSSQWNNLIMGQEKREREIISAIMKEDELNPENEKSVIM